MSEKEYLEMKKKVNQYEYNQHRKEMKRIQNQKPSVDDLDLSVRLYNILKENQVFTIDELLTKSVSDFLKMKKFGRKCAHEIDQLYKDKGWEFANN